MAGRMIVPFREKQEQPFDHPGHCDKDRTSQYIFRSGKGIPGPLLPLPILVRLPWSKFYKVQFTNSKNPCCTVHCKKKYFTFLQLQGLDLVSALVSCYGPYVQVWHSWSNMAVMLADLSAVKAIFGNKDANIRLEDPLTELRGSK